MINECIDTFHPSRWWDVCVVLSIQAKCHPQYSRRICLAEREREEETSVLYYVCVCVCVWERRRWWWHSSPLRLVSSFSFLLLICLSAKKTLSLALSKVHSFILRLFLSLRVFFFFFGYIYTVNQSFRRSIHAYAIIIIEYFVQRAKTSLDLNTNSIIQLFIQKEKILNIQSNFEEKKFF